MRESIQLYIDTAVQNQVEELRALTETEEEFQEAIDEFMLQFAAGDSGEEVNGIMVVSSTTTDMDKDDEFDPDGDAYGDNSPLWDIGDDELLS